MTVIKKVVELKRKKEELEREIRKIQAECPHSNYIIRQVHNGSMVSIRKVCDECELVVGYPNKEEENKFLKN